MLLTLYAQPLLHGSLLINNTQPALSVGRESNPEPSEQQAGVLTTELTAATILLRNKQQSMILIILFSCDHIASYPQLRAVLALWLARRLAVRKALGSIPGHASCVLLIMKAAVLQWLGIHC